jgi:mannitol-1-phosphate 5-dehydrogenase
MKNTALIFGAGKTGRGFAAHLAHLGGYEIILIDKNHDLVAQLKVANRYDVQILNNEKRSSTIKVSGVYHIDDSSWHEHFVTTGLAFTSVFGNNLESVALHLQPALHRRYIERRTEDLTIITCENFTNAAGFLKETILKKLGQEEAEWLNQHVGFSESIIFRTCLEASAGQSPLTVRCQDFFELPCDGDSVRGSINVYGLKPLTNFSNQLRRKIYTYNCINAVIAYLGAKKGYSQLYEAGNDPEILETARKAASESSAAQVAEFGFDKREQDEWVGGAFAKFANKNIPDPIRRNAADPVRKLHRDDRLIGPALLALKHGLYPEGLLEGVVASLHYSDPDTNIKLWDLILGKGADFFLHEVCELKKEEELFMLIKERITKEMLHEQR